MKDKTKWILIGVIIVVVIILILYRFLVFVLQDEWSMEDDAVKRAKQETELTEVTKITRSVWDKVYFVIEGKDASEQEVMIWVPEDETDDSKIHIEFMKDGFNKEQIKKVILDQLPGIEIVRLVPGVITPVPGESDDQYVWQLFYKEKDHYYYSFYNYNDGTALPEVYTLPNR